MTSNQFNISIWFPGLEAEKPAALIWIAGTPELALQQVQSEYPECKVELRS